MQNLVAMLGTLLDLLLVVLGFSLIVFFHELGHFVAAKWAGIRVLAFAIGFGPAIVTYRKGLGFRRGSSEAEYAGLIGAAEGDVALRTPPKISPTEYRINWLPLGGYVKMLGQEDLNPGATSTARDSYQSTPPWKRMIVISAGVVMNVIVAAALFIIVFMAGLKTEPPVIGAAIPGLPASTAVPVNSEQTGVATPGLQSGDLVLSIDGERPESFNDLVLAAAMARRREPVQITVSRPGVAEPLEFRIVPEESADTGLLDLGVLPARSPQLFPVRTDEERALFKKFLAEVGLPDVEPGMRLVRAGDDTSIEGAHELTEAVRASGGAPVPVEFEAEGRRIAGTITPLPELETDIVHIGEQPVAHQHLLGLTPVMTVASAGERAKAQGLQDGDIFLRLGTLEYPSVTQGIGEIRRHKGRNIAAVVLRRDGAGEFREVELEPRVTSNGTIGFSPGDTAEDATLLALPPRELTPMRTGAEPYTPAAVSLIERPGTRLAAIDGAAVSDFAGVRAALREATAEAAANGSEASVDVTLRLPLPPLRASGEEPPTRTIVWTLSAADVRRLHELAWHSPLSAGLFEPVQIERVADNPVEAVRMGLHETRRVLLTTYVTFARLFQGTVKVEHLRGPVGIAALGTQIASKGIIWLLFFMALISINLAVVNFLPMPIMDGGQFLFLLFEQIRGKPASIAVQNAATFVGLMIIGAVFLIVTFNDIVGLFGG